MNKLKKVPGFSGYFVSADGKVYSKKRGNELVELSPSTATGYAHVKFSNGPEKQNFQVHRLVARLFIPNRKKLEIVNHIDGNKLNNKPSNLEYITISENIKHSIKLGLHVCNRPENIGTYIDGRTRDKVKYKHEWYLKNREKILLKLKQNQNARKQNKTEKVIL